jgi:hypothetical protein
LKNVPERKEWPKIRSEKIGVSYTNAKKKGPQRHSGLRPSKKEHPERRSGAYRHKNTPVLYIFITNITS